MSREDVPYGSGYENVITMVVQSAEELYPSLCLCRLYWIICIPRIFNTWLVYSPRKSSPSGVFELGYIDDCNTLLNCVLTCWVVIFSTFHMSAYAMQLLVIPDTPRSYLFSFTFSSSRAQAYFKSLITIPSSRCLLGFVEEFVTSAHSIIWVHNSIDCWLFEL